MECLNDWIEGYLNRQLFQTEWYKSFFIDIDHNIYPDSSWLRTHEERNFDVVNLGSSGGKYAFDYNGFGIKGMNWAQQPQTLVEDYNLLRCFHSILKKGGYVLITIMPFTGINKKTGFFDAIKYLKIDTQDNPIEPYMYLEAKRYASNPILFGKKKAIKIIIKHLRNREQKVERTGILKLDYNPLSDEQLEKDARKWMLGWKNQFNIVDFEAPLTEENEKGREYRIGVMRNLVDFCIEREYIPVYVIPPVTTFLANKFTSRFREIYIYDYLKQINRNVTLLDYLNDNIFYDKTLYFNSFFLNYKGRKLFTKHILSDLGLI